MGISKRFQIITFMTWIVIVPPGIFLAFTLFPSSRNRMVESEHSVCAAIRDDDNAFAIEKYYSFI